MRLMIPCGNMIKVFISQPMSGRTEEDILDERSDVLNWILNSYGPAEIIDSYISEFPPQNVNDGVWYLAKSLEFLAEADVAYFVRGWEDARGCRIEHAVAESYGIPIIEE